ncbi:MAG: hypothetical protein LAN64_02160 [Acidobacteriia bacterium]|nr:hypothetical protein [Terriglobia bacterium]
MCPTSIAGAPKSATAVVPSSRRLFATGALAVLIAYSLPLLLGWARSGHVPNLLFSDETIYAARVLDAYRGGTLASPYLAGHDDAPRYMPEISERALALIAQLTRTPPLTILALSRVMVPLLIFLALWRLARGLDLAPALALLAALIAVLGLSTHAGGPHFLRYLRLVSPATYALLLLIALQGWLRVWKKPSLKAALFAGIAGGALFYVAMYYWSFAAIGALVLALTPASSRRWIFAALGVSILVGAPALWNAAVVARITAVQQTLHRFNLLTPGRGPDVFVLPRFVAAVVFCAVLWTQRRRIGTRANFLLAFLVPGTVLLVQNAVTNRHAQSYHWVECLIPVGALAVAVLIEGTRWCRPRLLYAAAIVIVVAGIASHAGAYFIWEDEARRDPLDWRIDRQIPGTLAWLNANTPPRSILLLRDYGNAFPMYAANKLYFAYYASQHVISDDELERRRDTAEQFDPAHPTPLPYPADYYLGLGERCAAPALPVLYRNPAEGTCVLDLRARD